MCLVGFAKRMMEDATARMFWPSSETICRCHVLNAFLLGKLDDVEGAGCALCGRPSRSYVDLDDVRDLVVAVIRNYRLRAIDELYHDRETASGYAILDEWAEYTADVVGDLFGSALDDILLDRVAETLDDECWFRSDRFWLEGTQLYLESWAGFRELVRRLDLELQDLLDGKFDRPGWRREATEGIRPSEVLPRVMDLAEIAEVVVEIPSSTLWCRAVHLSASEVVSASRVGTAPTQYARENRMSRAGQPLFYGAVDAGTAAAEIGNPAPDQVTIIGEWRPSRPLLVLNLAASHDIPDFYDVDRSGLRWRLQFLDDFAEDVSQPIGPHETVEYRATQVLTDFLVRLPTGLDGILYRSSRTGRACCAIKVDNEHCVNASGASPNADAPLQMILDQALVSPDLGVS